MSTIDLTIDGRQVSVPAGSTVLDAARVLGIAIPTLCHLPGKPAQTACLVCVVRIDGGARLLPACATKVAPGMAVDSSTSEVHAARRTALELLLGYHLGDCLAPCENICPTHYEVPELLRLAKGWRQEEALAVMVERAALPGVLARICQAPCEKGCRRTQADGTVSVRAIERFVTDADLASPQPYTPACKPDSDRRVAIVGAGPAGLAVAFHLRRFGHAVVLFDAAAEPGGALQQIDAELLPRTVLSAEIARVLRLGASFTGGQRLGGNLSLDTLRRDFDAVVLACGEIDAARAQALGLAFGGKGLVADTASGATALVGVYAAGSVVAPARQTVRAVASGRDAAVAVDRYLLCAPSKVEGRGWSMHLGKVSAADLKTFISWASPSRRLEPQTGGCLAEDDAISESARCLACSCSSRHTCTLRQYAEAYGADPNRFRSTLPPLTRDDTHPLVIYEPGKCIACGLCVQIAADAGERLGLGFAGRGFTIQVAVPLGGTMRDALAISARACAAACPTGAIELRPAAADMEQP